MGIHTDTQDEVRKERATKIFGQPMANDITQREKELIAFAAAIPTSLEGGNNVHAGMIVDHAKYLIMTGTPFIDPQNPGVYPANIAGNKSAQGSTSQRTHQRVQNLLWSRACPQGYHPQSS
jgi:hypothetical protein